MNIIGYKIKKRNGRYSSIRIIRAKREPSEVIKRIARLTGCKTVLTISGKEF